MGAKITVDRLNEAEASSIVRRIPGRCESRLADPSGQTRSVDIDTDGHSVVEIVAILEEWTALSGRSALCVRLDGATYMIEPRAGPVRGHRVGSSVAQSA